MKDYNTHLKVNNCMSFLLIYFIWKVLGDKGALVPYIYSLHTVAVPCSDLDKELHTVTGWPWLTWASHRTAFTYWDGDLHSSYNFHYMYYI